MSGDTKLRSKRELIEKFINTTLPEVKSADEVAERFDAFLGAEKQAELERISQEVGVDTDKFQEIIGRYLHINQLPKRTDFDAALTERPSIFKRTEILNKVKDRFMNFVDTFIDSI